MGNIDKYESSMSTWFPLRKTNTACWRNKNDAKNQVLDASFFWWLSLLWWFLIYPFLGKDDALRTGFLPQREDGPWDKGTEQYLALVLPWKSGVGAQLKWKTNNFKTRESYLWFRISKFREPQNYRHMWYICYHHHTPDTSNFLIQQKPSLLDQEAAATASAPAVLGRCAFLWGKNKKTGPESRREPVNVIISERHLVVFLDDFLLVPSLKTNRSSLKIGAWARLKVPKSVPKSRQNHPKIIP